MLATRKMVEGTELEGMLNTYKDISNRYRVDLKRLLSVLNEES